MKVNPVSEIEFKVTIISQVKNLTGYDGMPNKILKRCINYIIKPLTHMCNCSLTLSGKV
jgi:hypothetical protein